MDATPLPLRQQLRQCTAAAHARLDASLDPWADADAYRAYLRGMQAFLADVAAVLGDAHWLLAPLREPLARDLGAGSAGADPRAQPAGHAAPEPDPARRAGWEYVACGATLGAQLLLRQGTRLQSAGATLPLAFLTAFAGSGAWSRFLPTLASIEHDPAARARACDAAVEAFESATHALRRDRTLTA